MADCVGLSGSGVGVSRGHRQTATETGLIRTLRGLAVLDGFGDLMNTCVLPAGLSPAGGPGLRMWRLWAPREDRKCRPPG